MFFFGGGGGGIFVRNLFRLREWEGGMGRNRGGVFFFRVERCF